MVHYSVVTVLRIELGCSLTEIMIAREPDHKLRILRNNWRKFVSKWNLTISINCNNWCKIRFIYFFFWNQEICIYEKNIDLLKQNVFLSNTQFSSDNSYCWMLPALLFDGRIRGSVFPFETSDAHKSMNTKLRTNAPVMNVSAFNIAISKSKARWYKEEFPLVLPAKKQRTKSKEIRGAKRV